MSVYLDRSHQANFFDDWLEVFREFQKYETQISRKYSHINFTHELHCDALRINIYFDSKDDDDLPF